MNGNYHDLIVLFENEAWQMPLFEVLDRSGVRYGTIDLKSASISDRDRPRAPLYFNQASPSAYLRGNTRAVPFALALIEDLEAQGARVLNGSRPFRIELSKMAQIGLMRRLGVEHPRSWAFNDVESLRQRASELTFPAILKPNQGGSGARMVQIESLDHLAALLEDRPELWLPDNLLLLQEYLHHDQHGRGIVRMEYLDGELLYALRVVSGGRFNLCPSEVCNPQQGPSACHSDGAEGALGESGSGPRFYAYPDVPSQAVETGRRLFLAAGLDVGAVEYLETSDGRRVFYDINANSNLRRSMGAEFGFDPFERVVDFLIREIGHVESNAA